MKGDAHAMTTRAFGLVNLRQCWCGRSLPLAAVHPNLTYTSPSTCSCASQEVARACNLDTLEAPTVWDVFETLCSQQQRLFGRKRAASSDIFHEPGLHFPGCRPTPNACPGCSAAHTCRKQLIRLLVEHGACVLPGLPGTAFCRFGLDISALAPVSADLQDPMDLRD